MITFFQVLFFTASVVLIVMNVLEFNRYQESRRIKVDGYKPYSIRWFNFVLTSLVAIGCALDIVIRWISRA